MPKNKLLQSNLAPQVYWDNSYKKFTFNELCRSHPITEKIYANFPEDKNLNVFEIGCYPGRILAHFGRLGHTVNGIDRTGDMQRMVEWLRSKGIKTGALINADAFEFTSESKFDVVYSCGFIEHFTNISEVIDLHISLVKPGGRIFITAPNFEGAVQKILHRQLDRENLKLHCGPSMNVAGWADYLRGRDFQIQVAGYFGGFDFWVGPQQRGALARFAVWMLTKVAPVRWLPSLRMYSPDGVLIAKAPEFSNRPPARKSTS